MAMELGLLGFQPQMYPSSPFLFISNHKSPKNYRTPNLFSGGRKTEIFKRDANTSHPHEVNLDVYHPPPPQKVEVFKTMEDWVEENVLIHLKPVERCWQPQDFLPDSSSDEFREQVKELQEMTKEIPDDYFVVLVGNMITEEALPTYQTRLNCSYGIWDETGFSPSPWGVWSRGWTSEENRHGDLLNKYLYLSGRVDMKQIEKTIQYLIASGINIRTENNPYKFIMYASFQERATFIAHSNTARIAKQHGDKKLAQICGLIAADEKRHETAYTKMAEKLFEIDPNEMVTSFADMLQNKISMPGHFMYDGRDNHIFAHYTSVASLIGVYSALDYINILEHLVKKYNVEKLTGLSSEGRKAQDYVCELAPRLRKVVGRAQQKGAKEEIYAPFSWIYGREVKI